MILIGNIRIWWFCVVQKNISANVCNKSLTEKKRLYDKDIINTSDKFQYCYEFGMFSLGNMNYTDTGQGFEKNGEDVIK